MKTYFRYILAPAALMFAMTSCFEATPTVEDQSLVASYNQAATREAAETRCQFSDRESIATVLNEQGVIMKVRTEMERGNATYLILLPGKGTRYYACNLPEDMKRDNLKVTFSGDEKKIYPDERWAGQPFLLTDIRMQME